MSTKEPLFSIITVATDDAAALRLTGKSLGLQLDAPLFEWLVVGGEIPIDLPGDLEIGDARILPSEQGLYKGLNGGIEQAKGRYLWFIKPGDCIADSYTLRVLAREIQSNLGPEILYGDGRKNGVLQHGRNLHRYQWGMPIPFPAMLARRNAVGDLRFDPALETSAEYHFLLALLARSTRQHYFPRVICDYAGDGIAPERLNQAYHDIRRDFLQMNKWRNKAMYYLNALQLYLRRVFKKR
ncbi:MAG: colanic acid biosynthesis glycosyl transferase [Alphaproteobacteria bacterium]|nr:colanic acid biosynthesis glycosyl transferase [Alphaproteobacteria bacterium]